MIRRTDSGQAAWKQFNELVADKNATPGMKTAYAQMFAGKMLAEQERLGVPAEAVRSRRIGTRPDQGPDRGSGDFRRSQDPSERDPR